MELYARTEQETYYPEPVLAASARFVMVKLGWFSYTFLREQGESVYAACQYVDAIRALDE